VLWGLIWGPILFNLFINDLDDGTECTISKFADDIADEECMIYPDGCAAIHKVLTGLRNVLTGIS